MPEEIKPVETITPFEVGKIIGSNAETVRAGLRANTFPFNLFGFAIPPKKQGGKWVYKIIKSKFINYINERSVITNEKEDKTSYM